VVKRDQKGKRKENFILLARFLGMFKPLCTSLGSTFLSHTKSRVLKAKIT